MSNLKSKVEFARWLKESDPFLFEAAKKHYQLTQAEELGAFSLPKINFKAFANSIVSTVKSVAPKLVEYRVQKEVLKEQMKRAEQGKPPLQNTRYTPTVPVNQVTPETEQAAIKVAQQSMGPNLGKMLPFIALGAGALYFMSRGKK